MLVALQLMNICVVGSCIHMCGGHTSGVLHPRFAARVTLEVNAHPVPSTLAASNVVKVAARSKLEFLFARENIYFYCHVTASGRTFLKTNGFRCYFLCV